jgi:hypothetical protein
MRLCRILHNTHMYHHSFELSFRCRNHTLISHNFLFRTYQLLLTCFQLPRSLVQNLLPSKLLRSAIKPTWPFLFVNIAFCVMTVGAFFLKYSSRPVLQLRSTSPSTCASLTDSNDDKDLVEEINLSSDSLIVCRWLTVRPGKIRSYNNLTMKSRCDHFFGTPPPSIEIFAVRVAPPPSLPYTSIHTF